MQRYIIILYPSLAPRQVCTVLAPLDWIHLPSEDITEINEQQDMK